MTNEEFLEAVGTLAREDLKKSGILASLTIAQAILESSWGNSSLAIEGKALFGIKATSSWGGKVYNKTTNECYDGQNMVEIEACFRAYDSWVDSVTDHSNFLTSSSRYAKVVGEMNYKVACQAIKDAGYATDPDYPSKLITLIERYTLTNYDFQEEAKMPKICLDAGHYSKTYNQSTQVSAYYESEMAWKLHFMLKTELEKRGFEVITTRNSQDSNPEVYDRGKMASGCDLFLSLHSNACGTESVDYTVVYRPLDNRNNANTLALNLAQGIGVLMGNKQTGRTGTRALETNASEEYYGVMRGAKAVNCPLYLLLEHSFHTNKNASLWLLEDSNLQKLAELEAGILADHYACAAPSATVTAPVVGSSTTCPYAVKVTDKALNIRSGVGTGYPVVGCITDCGIYTITEEKDGWGRLKVGKGGFALPTPRKLKAVFRICKYEINLTFVVRFIFLKKIKTTMLELILKIIELIEKIN